MIRIKATFGDCDRQSTFAAIVAAFDEPFANQSAHGVLDVDLMRKINMGRRTDFFAVANFQKLRGAKVAEVVDRGLADVVGSVSAGVTDPGYSSDEDDRVARVFKPLRRDVLFVIYQTNHGNSRCGIDYSCRTLIIQRDISARDRRAERAASFSNSFHGLAQLPEVFRLIRVAEIQVVGYCERAGARTREIACRLRHRNFGTFSRIERAVE